MIPATLESAEAIVSDLSDLCQGAMLVGDLRRGVVSPHDRADILCVPDNSKLAELSDYVNNQLGQVTRGRVGPNEELSRPFPSNFAKLRGRLKLCVWFVDPAEFGLMAFKLTGAACFVERGLKYWSEISGGGSHSAGFLIDKDGSIVPTPTEEHVFQALKCKFIPPDKRR